MSDIGDSFKALKLMRQADGDRRRASAAQDFRRASFLAADHGMKLVRRDDVHYQLFGDGWVLNLYPGNRRLYSDPNRRGPYLNVPHEWTLEDVVNAAIEAIQSKDVPR